METLYAILVVQWWRLLSLIILFWFSCFHRHCCFSSSLVALPLKTIIFFIHVCDNFVEKPTIWWTRCDKKNDIHRYPWRGLYSIPQRNRWILSLLHFLWPPSPTHSFSCWEAISVKIEVSVSLCIQDEKLTLFFSYVFKIILVQNYVVHCTVF